MRCKQRAQVPRSGSGRKQAHAVSPLLRPRPRRHGCGRLATRARDTEDSKTGGTRLWALYRRHRTIPGLLPLSFFHKREVSVLFKTSLNCCFDCYMPSNLIARNTALMGKILYRKILGFPNRIGGKTKVCCISKITTNQEKTKWGHACVALSSEWNARKSNRICDKSLKPPSVT